MLTINVTHRSDASSAVKSHAADQELFWSSVTEFKERLDARLRYFDFERHHWVVLAAARAELVEYLRRMETVYGARVEVGYETDAERTEREDEERREAEQHEEQRQAKEAETQRRRSQQQHQRQQQKKRGQDAGAKDEARAKGRKRAQRQRPANEPHSAFSRRMNAELAYATLYLTLDAPQEMIQSAWRTLAKIYHPDIGGDAATMARINDAYRFLQDAFKKRVDAA